MPPVNNIPDSAQLPVGSRFTFQYSLAPEDAVTQNQARYPTVAESTNSVFHSIPTAVDAPFGIPVNSRLVPGNPASVVNPVIPGYSVV